MIVSSPVAYRISESASTEAVVVGGSERAEEADLPSPEAISLFELLDCRSSSKIGTGGMKGEVDGIAMLREGGPSTGRKLLLLPRFVAAPPPLPKREVGKGKGLTDPPRGNVDEDVAVVLRPRLPASFAGTSFLVGRVIAERVAFMGGRTGRPGTKSVRAWGSEGGSSLRLAEADAANDVLSDFSDFSPFNRLIDILRRKPHLLVFVEALVVRETDLGCGGGEKSLSRATFPTILAARLRSRTPRFPNRLGADGLGESSRLNSASRDGEFGLSKASVGPAVSECSSLLIPVKVPADRIFRRLL